ncbi:MAG: phosphoserine transaminase [Actinomycetaceae bacterium]|nr:phosphoserine transaminase [Actinomycetaceae bacterium]
MVAQLQIPSHLIPADGRFGAGPSRVADRQIQRLVDANSHSDRALIMGTSHRQAPVRHVVGQVKDMLLELFQAPDDYQVVLGNGGASAFWAVAVTSLIARRSAHAVFGEFGGKFAAESARAPFLEDPVVVEAEAGSLATLSAQEGVDVYAWPHHETSTGVVSPVRRVAGADDALMVVDATSIAGGIEVDLTQTDAYYFAPQKCFGSDGGLWLALLSPAAVERARRLRGSEGRWMPQILDLTLAIDNSAKDQTLNTPALATLLMLHSQLEWMLSLGGLAACADRSKQASDVVYQWAAQRSWVEPFVADRELRSPVVVTVDFEGVDAASVARVLRENAIVDVEPYRKLGRNQLRIATFPSVEVQDVERLVGAIDWVAERLAK